MADSFFGSGSGFLPSRKKSGLGAPIQDVTATSAPQPIVDDSVSAKVFKRQPTMSISEQQEAQRRQLRAEIVLNSDSFGPTPVAQIQPYAPPVPAITRPPQLPNENYLISQFADQNPQTREQEIQKVLARDAGIAIPEAALAKVIPISRAMSGLGRLGAVADVPMFLPEVVQIYADKAASILNLLIGQSTGTPSQSSSQTAATYAPYISALRRAIDPSLTDAVAAIDSIAAAIPYGATKLPAAAATQLRQGFIDAINATTAIRKKYAAEIAAAGYTANNPPDRTNQMALAEKAGESLSVVWGAALEARPFLTLPTDTAATIAARMNARDARIRVAASWIPFGIDSSIADVRAAIETLVAAALDQQAKKLTDAEAEALRLKIQNAINATSQARFAALPVERRYAPVDVEVEAANFSKKVPGLNPWSLASAAKAAIAGTDAQIFDDALKAYVKVAAAVVKGAQAALVAELAARKAKLAAGIQQTPDDFLAALVGVINTGKGYVVSKDGDLNAEALAPFADIILAESKRRADIAEAARLAAEAAAAEAARKKAEAEEAARKAEEEKTRQAKEEADRKAAEAAEAERKAKEAEAEAKRLEEEKRKAAEAAAKKSSTTTVLLAVAGVLGVVYLVSKKQQTLAAAPLLLEDFD